MASIRHIFVSIGATTLSVLAGAAQAEEAVVPATVSVLMPTRLPGTSGDQVVLVPSTYTVEAIGTSGLRITGPDGTSSTVHATAHQVDARPDHPSAVLSLRPDGEHLVLTLPSGLELDAAGTVDGIRSRGLAPVTTARAPVATTHVPVFVPPPPPPIATAPVTAIPPVTPIHNDPCTGLSGTPPPALFLIGSAGAPFPAFFSGPPSISKVTPQSFAQGATVTICGKNLGIVPLYGYSAIYVDPFPPGPNGNDFPQLSAQLELGGYFVRLQTGVKNATDTDTRIQAVAPMVSASGDRIVFTAGAPFAPMWDCDHNVSPMCNSPGSLGVFLDPASPYATWPPLVWRSSWSGPLALEQNAQLVIGPSVTWQAGP